MAYLLSLIVNGVTRLQNDTHGTNIYADKHIKNNSNDNYILLGGGGHIDKGTFALASHDHSRLGRAAITSTNFNKAQWSGFYNVSADGATSLPGSNSGGNVAIHAAWDNGSNTAGMDLLINDSTTSNLYFRSRVGGGGIGEWRTIIDTNNYASYCATSNHNHDDRYLRKDANDSTSYQYNFTKTDDHAIKVGTIRGTAVGSQTGDFIHLYERVAIGSPSGWGSRNAPTYGLATYGGAWLATDTGSVGIGTTSPENKLDVNGIQQIYQRGNDNTAFKDLLLLKQQNSTEDANQDWTSSKPTFGIGFRRYWTSGSSPYGETTCAGIYATISSSWRGGLVFRTKNNQTRGGTHDTTALRLRPDGHAIFGSSVETTGFIKNGSSDSYVLLGGGGHKLESSLSVNYANTASGLDLNRTSITTGAAGWYKLAYYASTDPRGSVRIGLVTVGGSFFHSMQNFMLKMGGVLLTWFFTVVLIILVSLDLHQIVLIVILKDISQMQIPK